MVRSPSIHIREQDLACVLYEVLKRNDTDIIARKVLEKAKSFSIPSRSISVTNDKLDKKVNKLKLAGRSDTAIFAQLLLLLRRKLKHRGITLIQPGDADWLNLKEGCKLATDFCNEFQIQIKEGYKEYISIGLSMMKNFSIFKFKNLHSAICNIYEARLEIESDKYPEQTKKAHDLYLAMISEKVGYSQGYENVPEKYKYFIYVVDICRKFGITLREYLKSQFSAFDWRNGIPDPMQLSGDKAIERLQRYAYENQIHLGQKKGIIDFKSIKKSGKRNNK